LLCRCALVLPSADMPGLKLAVDCEAYLEGRGGGSQIIAAHFEMKPLVLPTGAQHWAWHADTAACAIPQQHTDGDAEGQPGWQLQHGNAGDHQFRGFPARGVDCHLPLRTACGHDHQRGLLLCKTSTCCCRHPCTSGTDSCSTAHLADIRRRAMFFLLRLMSSCPADVLLLAMPNIEHWLHLHRSPSTKRWTLLLWWSASRSRMHC
jgi:hypothetical protein